MNINTYIKKLQEIETLKFLILSKEQLNLFNFLNKPLICVNSFNSEIYEDYLLEINRKIIINKDEVDLIHQSYNNIVNKNEKNTIEEKLLQLVETEIKTLQ